MTIRKHLVLMDLSAYSFQSSEPTFVMQPTTELVVAGYISKKIPELEGARRLCIFSNHQKD
jgi:hypothetical protein